MRTMVLTLDEDDYDTIQREIAQRQASNHAHDGAMLPEGESGIAGAHLAEAIRDLDEYRALWKASNPC